MSLYLARSSPASLARDSSSPRVPMRCRALADWVDCAAGFAAGKLKVWRMRLALEVVVRLEDLLIDSLLAYAC